MILLLLLLLEKSIFWTIILPIFQILVGVICLILYWNVRKEPSKNKWILLFLGILNLVFAFI